MRRIPRWLARRVVTRGTLTTVKDPRRLPIWSRQTDLWDRRAERKVLEGVVEAIRAGESRALVIQGDAGVGKSALLDYLSRHAEGCRVARAAGVQSEMELAFAGIHQLCGQMLDRLDAIPGPQAEALRTAFGLSEGPSVDPFLLGLAVLSLLSEVAAQAPLLCLIDDQQWLDWSSALLLGFAARRLGAESLGLIFAVREPNEHLSGLPELSVAGLPQEDAGGFLDWLLPGKVDDRIREQIILETKGNPLALLELSRELLSADPPFGLELPRDVADASSIEDSYVRRIGDLPDATRRVLLLAAADPTGDAPRIWRAAGRLGIEVEAAAAAAEAGLADFGARVHFRHPLARSAAYRAASSQERQEAHRVLAEVTDPLHDPERRAWHRAAATSGPDEEVAGELEKAGLLALARGCLGTAGAYMRRAVVLTIEPERRAERAVLAAQGQIRMGSFDVAMEMLAAAETGSISDLQRAHLDLVRAQLAYVTNRGSDAPKLLLTAAKRLEPIDVDLSRAAYLDALSAAIFAGRLASPGAGVLDVALAVASAPRPAHPPTVLDLLLDGLAATYNRGYAAGLPMLHLALTAPESAEDQLRWLWLTTIAAMRVWDDDRLDSLSARHVQIARDAAAISELPLALASRTVALLFAGELVEAAWLVEESKAVQDAIGRNLAPYGALGLAALRGDADIARTLIEETIDDVRRRGEGVGVTMAEWANALLHNGLGRYDAALAAARRATAYGPDPGSFIWPLVELVEAAARVGTMGTARSAFDRLSHMTSASGTEWALGLEARSGALLEDGEEAERRYKESIARLGRTRQRPDLARAHLVYGEWLRRHQRHVDAREQLRTAHRMLDTMGMNGFAERARRELRATGEAPRKRTPATAHTELTPQESQIAWLARDGLSNPEIGTRLFISAHTVQYHLRKVFAKLGITSRSQLRAVLPKDPRGT